MGRRGKSDPGFFYSCSKAQDTFVNGWFEREDWFTFRMKAEEKVDPEYRIEIEHFVKTGAKYKTSSGEIIDHDFPIIVVSKELKEDPWWKTEVNSINEEMIKAFKIRKGPVQYLRMKEWKALLEKENGLWTCDKLVDRTEDVKKIIKSIG